MSNFTQFKERFAFNEAMAYHVGIERECFITDSSGTIVPKAQAVLEHIHARSNTHGHNTKKNGVNPFGYELSACQIEMRTQPTTLEQLGSELLQLENRLDQTLKALDLGLSHQPVAPNDMPLDVYPDPTGRYAEITKTMPKEVLLAACQVIGTHVHIGMPNHDTALNVYNNVIRHSERLCQLGNPLGEERMEIYKVVAPQYVPPRYNNWDELYQKAKENDFVDDIRSCWTVIRLTVHGTIEFRMFGATNSIDQIMEWARHCHKLCTDVS